jgi:hypothetical protein
MRVVFLRTVRSGKIREIISENLRTYIGRVVGADDLKALGWEQFRWNTPDSK